VLSVPVRPIRRRKKAVKICSQLNYRLLKQSVGIVFDVGELFLDLRQLFLVLLLPVVCDYPVYESSRVVDVGRSAYDSGRFLEEDSVTLVSDYPAHQGACLIMVVLVGIDIESEVEYEILVLEDSVDIGFEDQFVDIVLDERRDRVSAVTESQFEFSSP